jgi:hypothetical protein
LLGATDRVIVGAGEKPLSRHNGALAQILAPKEQQQ